MSGFLNSAINYEFKNVLLKKIIKHLLDCCDKMITTCCSETKTISNDENKIRNHLLENYLNENSGLNLRFVPETPENYSHESDNHRGRADIKVLTENWFYKNTSDYYLIECKRIDGSNGLNEKYVSEGISRFVVEPVKYTSYNNCNIVFGFVVKQINIIANTENINSYQKSVLKTIKDDFKLLLESKNKYCTYISTYALNTINLDLHHIFYDVSKVIS